MSESGATLTLSLRNALDEAGSVRSAVKNLAQSSDERRVSRAQWLLAMCRNGKRLPHPLRLSNF